MTAASRPTGEDETRFEDLCVDATLGALDPADADEFARLRTRLGDVKLGEFEFAAAATVAHLAGQHPETPPVHLVNRLLQLADESDQANGRSRARHVPSAFSEGRPEDRASGSGATGPGGRGPTPGSPHWAAWSGWLAAAAAAVIAFLAWQRSGGAAPAADPALLRSTLIASATDLERLDWSRGPSEFSGSDAGGEVVWSDARQEGYMLFEGLPPNAAADAQYQLWIFDGERDLAQPVDGGVFDIPAGSGRVIIPIRAAIRVFDAKAFAITREAPGGVVVSKREHIVRTAGL